MATLQRSGHQAAKEIAAKELIPQGVGRATNKAAAPAPVYWPNIRAQAMG